MEAVDEFDAILEAVPTHHRALANRAWSLRELYPWVEGHTAILAAALADIEQAVTLARDEPVFQAKYKRFRDELKGHVSPLSVSPQNSSRRDVQWLWESRLALNPCLDAGCRAPAGSLLPWWSDAASSRSPFSDSPPRTSTRT